MVKVLIVIAILALLAFVVFGQYVSVRNTLVTKNEAVKASWSQVDVVLQRRADLIPNLVATVKGIAQQEQTVFGDIAKARSALLSASTPSGKIAANQQLDGALGRLLAIVENYPQLKSNENFLRLQDELAGTENRIAVERKRYNDTLQDYNTYIQKFPNNIFAGWAGFKPNDAYFAASEGSRQVPTVNFAPPARPKPRPPRPRRNPRTSVEADFAVELGADDETLEVPWAAEDGGPRYHDLKRQPELLPEIEEASRAPELAEFLAVMNSPARNSGNREVRRLAEYGDQSRRRNLRGGAQIRLLRGRPVFAGGLTLFFRRTRAIRKTDYPTPEARPGNSRSRRIARPALLLPRRRRDPRGLLHHALSLRLRRR